MKEYPQLGSCRDNSIVAHLTGDDDDKHVEEDVALPYVAQQVVLVVDLARVEHVENLEVSNTRVVKALQLQETSYSISNISLQPPSNTPTSTHKLATAEADITFYQAPTGEHQQILTDEADNTC